jgi:two-component system, NtrC family, sensor histidine kinase HydH
MRKADGIRIGIIVFFTLAIGLFHYFTPLREFEWHYVYERLLYVPVALAAFWYGWRGGLATGVLAGITYAPHVARARQQFPDSPGGNYLEILLFCSVGVLVGSLAEREHKQKENYRKLVQQLSAADRELRENFEGMKRAERLFALGQLSAGLAHEIRNPLASISGAAGILIRNPDSIQKRQECLAIIDKESNRLNGLLTRFLDFAKPRPPRFQETEIGTALDTVIVLAAHAIHDKPILLKKDVAPNLPLLRCDPEQLEQVLLNLTINAIQASTDGGTVMLSAHHDEGRVLIDVKDEGCGVSPEHIDQVFDPFFTTKESGTGLGLPVAHEIIRQFGGALSAQRNPDRGMTFSVSLPRNAKGNHEAKTDSFGGR